MLVRRGRCPHRPVCRGSAAASILPCVKAAQCSHWVVRRSVAEVSALRADGGIAISGQGRAVRPYNRLPYLRLILALSFRASDRRHWRGNPSPFLCLRRGTFALGGKSTQKRRSNLRFENPLRAFTCFLSCQNKPRERCAVEISPKYCIVSASLFAAAFALKYRSNRFYRGRDQRQRRRRRDDPFVRTTNSNFRDRVAQTTDKHRA